MNKETLYSNLHKKLSAKGEYSKDGTLRIKVTKLLCEEIVNDIFNEIRKGALRGEKVSIPQLGIFRLKDRAGYTARNPKTGEKVKVKATKRLSFSPSKTIKADLQK